VTTGSCTGDMSDGPAYSGKVHIKVVRADELRTHLGRAPAPMVMLRVSVGGVAQPDLMKTTPKPGETSPEWGEEFVLNVSDARQSQLECTIWDTSDPQVNPVQTRCLKPGGCDMAKFGLNCPFE